MGDIMNRINEVNFKVAMNNEDKLAKIFQDVNIIIEITPEIEKEVVKLALKSYVIAMQGEIRPNWDKFMELGTPGKILFGDRLYGKKKRVITRAPTQEEIDTSAAKKFSKMDAAQIAEFVKTGKFPESI